MLLCQTVTEHPCASLQELILSTTGRRTGIQLLMTADVTMCAALSKAAMYAALSNLTMYVTLATYNEHAFALRYDQSWCPLCTQHAV